MTDLNLQPVSSDAPHVPVLIDEVIANLAVQPGETHVDGTFGAGGYTRALLGAGAGRVIAFDRDPQAIENGQSLVPDPRLTLVHDRFSQMDRVLAERGIAPVDGITLDIGVSSMQLDQADRGFSFSKDGPLDMRMSQAGESAADFLNHADEAEIARVIKDYGEEPRARTVARAIVAARPLTRTAELAAVVRKALGRHKGMKTDPATRTFQAIRIHLNAELDELEQGLRSAERALRPGGRLAVVTFHSLEDRIVKRFLRERSGATPSGSRHLPQVARGPAPTFDKVAKPVSPSEAELQRNPRALCAPSYRSAHGCARVGPVNKRSSPMSAHGFRSLYMAAGVAGAALGCYLVSLNVASERSKLEAVEAEIASTQRDIRVLQTEIGTRGRLAQLERWNANFIRLSAPSADQFLEGGFQLATMVKPQGKPAIDAPVVLAAAPKPEAVKQVQSPDQATTPAAPSAGDLMHVAGYKQPPQRTAKPATPATPVKAGPVKKAETPAGKPSTAKGAKIAAADPLAPLSAAKTAAKPAAPGTDKSRPKASPKPKDPGTPQ